MDKLPYRPHRSYFWPILLIGVGLIWLVGNLGAIAAFNLPVLFRLWPLLLIFVGIDLLIGRKSPVFGAILGVAAVITVAAFLIGGQSIGLIDNVKVKTEHFTAPLNQTTSANILLALSDSPAVVDSLTNSQNLIDANLTYIGTINFHVSGTQRKTVRLARNEADFLLFNPLYWDPSLNWQIGLNPDIPIDLSINGGSEESRLDLSRLYLSSLEVSMGSGASQITVPAGGRPTPIQAHGGSGEMDWAIPLGASLVMNLDGGSGNVDIQLPATPAVRLEIRDSGSGSITFPPSWTKIFTGKNNKGTWETQGYSQADHKIDILINHAGSGNIHIG